MDNSFAKDPVVSGANRKAKEEFRLMLGRVNRIVESVERFALDIDDACEKYEMCLAAMDIQELSRHKRKAIEKHYRIQKENEIMSKVLDVASGLSSSSLKSKSGTKTLETILENINLCKGSRSSGLTANMSTDAFFSRKTEEAIDFEKSSNAQACMDADWISEYVKSRRLLLVKVKLAEEARTQFAQKADKYVKRHMLCYNNNVEYMDERKLKMQVAQLVRLQRRLHSAEIIHNEKQQRSYVGNQESISSYPLFAEIFSKWCATRKILSRVKHLSNRSDLLQQRRFITHNSEHAELIQQTRALLIDEAIKIYGTGQYNFNCPMNKTILNFKNDILGMVKLETFDFAVRNIPLLIKEIERIQSEIQNDDCKNRKFIIRKSIRDVLMVYNVMQSAQHQVDGNLRYSFTLNSEEVAAPDS